MYCCKNAPLSCDVYLFVLLLEAIGSGSIFLERKTKPLLNIGFHSRVCTGRPEKQAAPQPMWPKNLAWCRDTAPARANTPTTCTKKVAQENGEKTSRKKVLRLDKTQKCTQNVTQKRCFMRIHQQCKCNRRPVLQVNSHVPC